MGNTNYLFRQIQPRTSTSLELPTAWILLTYEAKTEDETNQAYLKDFWHSIQFPQWTDIQNTMLQLKTRCSWGVEEGDGVKEVTTASWPPRPVPWRCWHPENAAAWCWGRGWLRQPSAVAAWRGLPVLSSAPCSQLSALPALTGTTASAHPVTNRSHKHLTNMCAGAHTYTLKTHKCTDTETYTSTPTPPRYSHTGKQCTHTHTCTHVSMYTFTLKTHKCMHTQTYTSTPTIPLIRTFTLKPTNERIHKPKQAHTTHPPPPPHPQYTHTHTHTLSFTCTLGHCWMYTCTQAHTHTHMQTHPHTTHTPTPTRTAPLHLTFLMSDMRAALDWGGMVELGRVADARTSSCSHWNRASNPCQRWYTAFCSDTPPSMRLESTSPTD